MAKGRTANPDGWQAVTGGKDPTTQQGDTRAMKTAAERIWAFHDGPFVGYFVGCEERGTNVAEYVRADIVVAEIARLRDALETIKSASKHYARGDCDLSYAHQSTHNLAAATLAAKP